MCSQRFIRQLATSAAEALSHNPLKFVCVMNTKKRKSGWSGKEHIVSALRVSVRGADVNLQCFSNVCMILASVFTCYT